MKHFPIAVTLLLILLLQLAKSEENLVRDSLLDFFSKLSGNNNNNTTISGWNSTSDPCTAKWRGVTCDKHLLHVQKIDLAALALSGVFDPGTLCLSLSLSRSLSIINVAGNSLRSSLNFPAISNCSALAHLDISSNNISAPLPDLSRMSTLTAFLAQQNNFHGEIPDLDFTRFRVFNVSHNRLSGLIPVGARGLPPGSFLDNPELCGPPLTDNCSSVAAAESAPSAPPPSPPPPPPPHVKKEGLTNKQILMYMGYVAIAFVAVLLVLIWLRKKAKKSKRGEGAGVESVIKPAVEVKEGKNEYLSAESGQMSASASLMMVASGEGNGMRFDELLKAPAELLGRGSHGSVYKVVCEDHGMVLAVKRIKDWQISSGEFRQRMKRLNQVKHTHVMPAVAYYSSGQEKLIVYEFQQNGNLFKHIHGRKLLPS
ncbi:hypothetical protein SASPL_157824 [Salvia splendens]|uniref:Protein kinase domain-containing protein n=1 Tax=Salvia splendens TaxID=180675 RepID=A0A8X8VUA6_SALSN|nr:hypothetical protein SASPL_157824 [Salvia splendens]